LPSQQRNRIEKRKAPAKVAGLHDAALLIQIDGPRRSSLHRVDRHDNALRRFDDLAGI
jgi:hypothetical protein